MSMCRKDSVDPEYLDVNWKETITLQEEEAARLAEIAIRKDLRENFVPGRQSYTVRLGEYPSKRVQLVIEDRFRQEGWYSEFEDASKTETRILEITMTLIS